MNRGEAHEVMNISKGNNAQVDADYKRIKQIGDRATLRRDAIWMLSLFGIGYVALYFGFDRSFCSMRFNQPTGHAAQVQTIKSGK